MHAQGRRHTSLWSGCRGTGILFVAAGMIFCFIPPLHEGLIAGVIFAALGVTAIVSASPWERWLGRTGFAENNVASPLACVLAAVGVLLIGGVLILLDQVEWGGSVLLAGLALMISASAILWRRRHSFHAATSVGDLPVIRRLFVEHPEKLDAKENGTGARPSSAPRPMVARL